MTLLRMRVGALAFDRPPLAWPLFLPAQAERRWTEFHNRRERIVRNPAGRGFDCDWRWTSDLTLASVLPRLGSRLLAAALTEWPVDLISMATSSGTGEPDVSFVIGHRGMERLPLLRATLASLRGQLGCGTEILVVEQSEVPLLEGKLPADVRHIHQKLPKPGMPYSRSWAFNAGVREARGRFVVLHDNDILAPAGYAAEVLRLGRTGFDAMRLQRFVFYLDVDTTARVAADRKAGRLFGKTLHLELVRQNCEGHTIAVARDEYLRIGGHDEAFLGWGGEDNEFYDRCRLLRFHPWGYLPFLHLWHVPQPGKRKPIDTLAYLDETMAVPREERARRLSALPFGSPDGPLLGRTS